MFPTRGFMVSDLTFNFLIHFESFLCMVLKKKVWGGVGNFIPLHVEIPWTEKPGRL